MAEVNRKELLETAVELLQGLGRDAEVHEGYSGRGMYGDETDGITTNAGGVLLGVALAEAWRQLADESEDSDVDDIHGLVDLIPGRVDDMGMSTIYY